MPLPHPIATAPLPDSHLCPSLGKVCVLLPSCAARSSLPPARGKHLPAEMALDFAKEEVKAIAPKISALTASLAA